MADITENNKKIAAALRPAIEALVRKVHSLPNLCVTGFIFGGTKEDPYIARFGNITDQGLDFVMLHYNLAITVAEMHAEGHFSEDRLSATSEGSTPEEIADKLALTLMATPSEMLPSQITDVLKRYLDAREPEKT